MSRSHVAASDSLERGTQFLLANQGPDGLWHDFLTPAGEGSEWPTGFIATALHRAAADPVALERVASALVARQDEDGGWGYNEDVPSDADSTAWALLLLASTSRPPSSCERARSCLVRHQSASGGVATYGDAGPIRRFMGVGRWMRFGGWCSPHTEVTAVAGRALAAAGSDGSGAEADAAWQYVRSQQRPNGSWSSYWWTSPHYTTLEAVELAASFGDKDSVARAADWALRSQGHDGGWSVPGAPHSAFTTALSLSVLLIAGKRGQPVERAISKLIELQDDDGGWASHAILRIPPPNDADPDGRHFRLIRLGGGMVVRDQHRTFTTAACVSALARARRWQRGHP